MILADTSALLRALQNREPYAAEAAALTSRGELASHPLVYGELLIGDPGGRIAFLDAYAHLPTAPLVEHDEVVSLVRSHHLHGRGLHWIDARLLASALAADLRLWTADAPLAAAARDLGVVWRAA